MANEEHDEAAADYILEHMHARTMGSVEWKDSEHRGAGATDVAGNLWIMLDNKARGYIFCIAPNLSTCEISADNLIPNGERYELNQVRAIVSRNENVAPGHPEFLASIEEYRDAPDGSVAAADGYVPFIKSGNMWSVPSAVSRYTHVEMADNNRRRVLRWGIGGDA